jgi:hypothetical protein
MFIILHQNWHMTKTLDFMRVMNGGIQFDVNLKLTLNSQVNELFTEWGLGTLLVVEGTCTFRTHFKFDCCLIVF